MEGSLDKGKLPPGVLARVLREVASSSEVRLGPSIGEDAAAVEVGGGVLVVASDPITLTGSALGRYAVVINANDVAVMGVRPRWFLATVLLPPGTTVDDVESLFGGLRDATVQAGVILVGGHTEVTDAVGRPVVVGTMLGFAADGRFLSTSGAAPGDVVVQVGAVPIEGAAVLATEARTRLSEVEPSVLDAASRAASDPGISVVEAALAAGGLGATALHDPTEGGLASGLHELASASGVGLVVDRRGVLWFPPGVAVCEALGADPWATIASGAVVAVFSAERADAAVDALNAAGHQAARIATVVEGEGVHDRDGRPITWPERDEVARVLT